MKSWKTRLNVDPETNEIRISGKGAMVGKVPTLPSTAEPAEGVHPLFTGSMSDSVAAREALAPYYDALLSKLGKLEEALIETANPKFNDYKPEVAQRKRFDVIKPVLDEIDETVNERFRKAQKGIDYAQNVERAARELVEPENDTAGLRADLKAQEIRRAVESMIPNERIEFINAAVDRQDMFTLTALNESYRPVVKNDPHAIDKAIDHVVNERFPFVADIVTYHNEVAKGLRHRTQEFRTTQRQLARNFNLDLEKLQRASTSAR